MFDHVLGRGVPKRRFVAGALLALVVYVPLAVALAGWRIDLGALAARAAEPWTVVFFTGGSPAPPRAGSGKALGARQLPTRPRPPALAADPQTMQAHREEAQPSAALPGDGLLHEEDLEGRGDGDQAGGQLGPCQGDACGDPALHGIRCSDDAPCTAVANLSPPVLLDGSLPEYTPEAVAAGVEGLMVVTCVVTHEGTVRDCAVERSLPHMDQAVVRALTSRRYVPAKLLGEPVAVQYQFHVRLVLPAEDAPRRVTLPSAPIPL